MIIGAKAKVSVLDNIVTKVTRFTAREGFGIAQKYRQNHSVSEEDTFRMILETFATTSPADSTFKKCGCEGILVHDREGSRCEHCGVFAETSNFVSLSHEKATHPSEDTTTRCDEPPVEPDLFKPGFVETAQQAASRHERAAGGTVLGKRTSRRLRCGTMSSKLRREATNEQRKISHMATTQISQRMRSIQIALELAFNLLGKVHDELRTYIRTTTAAVYEKSETHSRVCMELCEFSLVDASSGMIAVVAINVLCEVALKHLNTKDARVHDKEITKAALLFVIERARQIPLREGSVHVAKCRGVFEHFLNDVNPETPCIQSSASFGSTSAATTTTTTQDEEEEDEAEEEQEDTGDHNDSIFLVRNAIWCAFQLGAASAILRDRALKELANPQMCDFVKSGVVHSDVAAVVILSACCSKTTHHTHSNAQQQQLDNLLQRATSSTQTSLTIARDAIQQILPFVSSCDSSVDDDSMLL